MTQESRVYVRRYMWVWDWVCDHVRTCASVGAQAKAHMTASSNTRLAGATIHVLTDLNHRPSS